MNDNQKRTAQVGKPEPGMLPKSMKDLPQDPDPMVWRMVDEVYYDLFRRIYSAMMTNPIAMSLDQRVTSAHSATQEALKSMEGLGVVRYEPRSLREPVLCALGETLRSGEENRRMKTAFGIAQLIVGAAVLIALCLISTASPITVCPPDFTHDAIPVTVGCPGLGALAYAIPNSPIQVAFNDNPISQDQDPNGANRDADINDAWANCLVNGDGTQTTCDWGGSLSALVNQIGTGGVGYLSAASPGPWTFSTIPYSDIPLQIIVQGGEVYGTGVDGDGIIHAWVGQTVPGDPGSVPEPSTPVLIVGGLGALVTWRKVWRP